MIVKRHAQPLALRVRRQSARTVAHKRDIAKRHAQPVLDFLADVLAWTIQKNATP